MTVQQVESWSGMMAESNPSPYGGQKERPDILVSSRNVDDDKFSDWINLG